jgi:hypothetical protein
MVYLSYLYGWSGGEPYAKMLGVFNTPEKADEAISIYLSVIPLDSDGQAWESQVMKYPLDTINPIYKVEMIDAQAV